MPAQWFEDEDFWRELYPYMFPPERLAAAADEVAQILAIAEFSGHTVLDLCCGPGRHSVAFAARGYDVTGVDRSPLLLDKARQRGIENGAAIEWVLDDMRRFVRPAAFGLACSLFTSFGYFETEEDDLRVLRNVHESLKSGGIFVMELISKEHLARAWESTRSSEFPDGTRLIQQAQVRNDWSRIHCEWIVIRDGRARTFRFEHTAYSGRELKDRLLQCGFHDVRLFGNLHGAPYGLDAARLVAVARKGSFP
jgi:SAM-dependent methyltransferase